jgi:hypothetical protein
LFTRHSALHNAFRIIIAVEMDELWREMIAMTQFIDEWKI